MNLFNNKRCPRCDTKVPKEAGVCPGCRLNYEKFNQATNKDAKELLKQGEKDKVVMRKGFPTDVKKWLMVLITVLFGYTGAHYYMVGRTKMGLFFTSFFVVGLINAGLQLINFSNKTVKDFVTFLSLIWGLVLALWIFDIAKVILNKFKIPVGRKY